MFASWARIVVANHRRVLVGSVLFVVLAALALARGGVLSSGMIDGIEAERGLTAIEDATGRREASSFSIVFQSPDDQAIDPVQIDAAVARLAADPHVLTVETPGALPGPLAARIVSPDGKAVLVRVLLKDDFREAARQYPRLRGLLGKTSLRTLFTGHLAFKSDLDHILETDLIKAEAVSVPIALLVLLAVFATAVAAFLPIGVGGLAVAGGVAAIFVLSHSTDMAQYTVNVTSLIGLGVAIDYSLFIVSRYREELTLGKSTGDAIVVAISTAGRAVAFSGLAVGIGLAGLLFFPRSYLFAMGLAGAIVVALAVITALTFLPAVLALLGPRVHAGRVPFALPEARGVWRAIAEKVMARPLMVLAPALVVLVAIGLPFRGIRLAAADVRVLPRSAEARRGDDAIRAIFPEEAKSRIAIVTRFPGSPLASPERIGALFDLSRRVAALPGVDRVEGPVDLSPSIDRATYQTLYAAPSPMLQPVLDRTIGPHEAIMAAVTALPPSSDAARAIVRAIRADRHVGDGVLIVTGETANDLDTTAFIVGHTPAAVTFVILATYVVLLMLLGSVILPLKAVVMNLLSIAGSFGALVWIFQDGHLSHLLGFEPRPTEPTLPVLLFCALFGLSMDYEVLLLTRMQEEWRRTGDNMRAVAEGLERSGRLITSAAAIMVSVFAAFALARVVLVKAMGIGMALAVALDATLVRILIVPATMRLFGDLNWWSPKWLRGRSLH